MKGYLRVSEILARLQNFDAIDPEVLDNKAKIGTNVHNAILQDTAGDFPLLETQRASAYFGSYLMWKKKEKPVFKMQVPRLYCNDLMITGEIDGLIETNRHQSPVLIDWKCSASANEEIWNMQAHFYWYLLERNGITASCNEMKWINLRHEKKVEMGPLGEKIVRYHPLAPKICNFVFNENTLSQCIQEAHKAWEEKKNSHVLD